MQPRAAFRVGDRMAAVVELIQALSDVPDAIR
jgi:hypothetical protein